MFICLPAKVIMVEASEKKRNNTYLFTSESVGEGHPGMCLIFYQWTTYVVHLYFHHNFFENLSPRDPSFLRQENNKYFFEIKSLCHFKDILGGVSRCELRTASHSRIRRRYPFFFRLWKFLTGLWKLRTFLKIWADW